MNDHEARVLVNKAVKKLLDRGITRNEIEEKLGFNVEEIHKLDAESAATWAAIIEEAEFESEAEDGEG